VRRESSWPWRSRAWGLGRESIPHPLPVGSLLPLLLVSIPGNTSPIGHVICSLAIALVLWTVLPLAGGVFLWVPASIPVASVVLRCHYAADSLLGIVLATVSFKVLG